MAPLLLPWPVTLPQQTKELGTNAPFRQFALDVSMSCNETKV
jgi:hypothetical protein